jgi:flagellar basal body-associated protein FliL
MYGGRMNSENTNNERKGSRWLRLGVLTFTLAGPLVNTIVERVRERSQVVRDKQTQAPQEETQSLTVRRRLDQLALESRQLLVEQTKQLHQLQSQAFRLRKTLRKNAKQQRKLVKRLRKSSAKWRQNMLKRGGQVTEEVVERGKEALEASTRMTQDLTRRGSRLTEELAERSSKATQKIARQGSKIAEDLVERGEQLLHPERKRNRNFWAMIGFGVGLVAAAVTTYLFVRRRVLQQQEAEASDPIELLRNESWNGTTDTGRPAGEILLVDDIGTAVATLPVIDVEQMQRPDDAVFVGVASTRFYYPVDTPLEEKDLVYFVSEEEARTQGFTAAQQ